MKLKMIMAACAAACSTGAFAAATPVTCTDGVTTIAGTTYTQTAAFVNTCAPEVTFYVGGASAQAGALAAVLEDTASNTVFDLTKTRVKLTDTSTAVSGAGNTVAWYGYGAVGSAAAGKRVMVIYNKANGSAAGVAQLLTGKGTGAGEEITLAPVSVKNLAKGIVGTCAVTAESTGGSLGTANCTTEAAFKSAWGVDAQKSMHLALSDVRPNELVPGIIKKWDAAKFPAVTTAVQGFGVIVNAKLYSALIAKNVAEGKLDAACNTSQTLNVDPYVVTGACQPSISRADFASVMTGKIKTANALLNTTGDATKLQLQRRVASSGTQASAHIFFAGLNVQPKSFVTSAVLPAGTVEDLTVVENSTTGGVITGVSTNTTDYAMGVVSLENTFSPTKASSKIKGALFVKIDGYSPNYDAAGTLDAKARKGLEAGYPFAFEMQAIKPAAISGAYQEIANKIIAGLSNPANDLAGIALIGSTDATKNTPYSRGGNNFMPLLKTN